MIKLLKTYKLVSHLEMKCHEKKNKLAMLIHRYYTNVSVMLEYSRSWTDRL